MLVSISISWFSQGFPPQKKMLSNHDSTIVLRGLRGALNYASLCQYMHNAGCLPVSSSLSNYIYIHIHIEILPQPFMYVCFKHGSLNFRWDSIWRDCFPGGLFYITEHPFCLRTPYLQNDTRPLLYYTSSNTQIKYPRTIRYKLTTSSDKN